MIIFCVCFFFYFLFQPVEFHIAFVFLPTFCIFDVFSSVEFFLLIFFPLQSMFSLNSSLSHFSWVFRQILLIFIRFTRCEFKFTFFSPLLSQSFFALLSCCIPFSLSVLPYFPLCLFSPKYSLISNSNNEFLHLSDLILLFGNAKYWIRFVMQYVLLVPVGKSSSFHVVHTFSFVIFVAASLFALYLLCWLLDIIILGSRVCSVFSSISSSLSLPVSPFRSRTGFVSLPRSVFSPVPHSFGFHR